MKLSIIIVNWNSADYVRQCLLSIFGAPPKFTFEVIVIDNGSFDSCGEMLNREFPGVRFLQCEVNVGFARANNEAARRAKGEILLFLNPDTEIHAGALDILVSVVAKCPEAGAVGCRLLNSDGSLQRTSIQAFPTLLNQLLESELFRRWIRASFVWRDEALTETAGIIGGVEAISGACLMTTREVFERIGGLNESFFMYSEDTDYCFSTTKSGLTNYYTPEAVVVHHGGKSSSRTFSKFTAVMLQESIWRFFCQRKNLGYAVLFRVVVVLKAIPRIVIFSLAVPFSVIMPHFTSAAEGARRWTSVLRWAVGLERSWIRSVSEKRFGTP